MDSLRRACLVITLTLLFWRVSSICDTSTTAMVPEGNIGQASTFSWLGVLRVRLHDTTKMNIAVTGLVLIREKFALVNADDVSRIPEKTLKEDSHTMFLADTNRPWYCKPKSCRTHPEYDLKTVNTIAILELDLNSVETYPLRPICWPSRMTLNTSTFLYVTGYTDENKLLEKVIYRVDYTQRTPCEEFYDKAGLADKTRVPAHYLCGVSPFPKTHCVWDNGMSLVSNATGYFTLIGFGIRGPGCTAPARYIDLQRYYKWMEDATSIKGDDDEYRSDDAVEIDDVPIHDFFGDTRRKDLPKGGAKPSSVPSSLKVIYRLNPHASDTLQYFNVDPVDNHTIAIHPFNDVFELKDKSCTNHKTLMYREYFELKSFILSGVVYYKVSLYDLLKNMCTSVHVSIISAWNTRPIFSYKEYFDFGEGTALTSSEETADQLFKHIPIFEITTPKTDTKWKPGDLLKPNYLEYVGRTEQVLNYDLYVRIGFAGKAIMKVDMYAENNMPTTPKTRRKMGVGLTPEEKRAEHLKSWYDDLHKRPIKFRQRSRSGSKTGQSDDELDPDRPVSVNGFFKFVKSTPTTPRYETTTDTFDTPDSWKAFIESIKSTPRVLVDLKPINDKKSKNSACDSYRRFMEVFYVVFIVLVINVM